MAAEGYDRPTLPVAMAGFTVAAVVIDGFTKRNVVSESEDVVLVSLLDVVSIFISI